MPETYASHPRSAPPLVCSIFSGSPLKAAGRCRRAADLAQNMTGKFRRPASWSQSISGGVNTVIARGPWHCRLNHSCIDVS